ncbi:uncharacterized protein LACBIDRAFT_334486 [Laccaria bicolor S238N-H82]|uniref:Predicted protein n=1 Tax=Laccaria bicolor (strain S238N-H82 / ATCC MYA-4686) TaxID=486041 RepID=B0DZB8_LACBS|nr:uncharacterized protein LACBIDRAFT_334486 [Laccaria bicolor S238N-H82]EDR00060.1 predicted protein [Laccaria bicolor S238N-H82]|eukprot:XP_001889266.1 predicted protein [Laccaria bicolor S238N-H82]
MKFSIFTVTAAPLVPRRNTQNNFQETRQTKGRSLQGGGGTWNLDIQSQKKLRSKSSTPPSLYPSNPKEPSAIGSRHLRTSFTNDSDDFPCQFSTFIELVDWPGAMPTTYAPDIDSIAFRVSCPGNICKRHARPDVRKAEQQCTRLIKTLTYAGLKAVGRRGEALGHLLIFRYPYKAKVMGSIPIVGYIKRLGHDSFVRFAHSGKPPGLFDA